MSNHLGAYFNQSKYYLRNYAVSFNNVSIIVTAARNQNIFILAALIDRRQEIKSWSDVERPWFKDKFSLY